jgi:hypothetical protein
MHDTTLRRSSNNIRIVALCGDYIRRVLDWLLDLLGHTQLQNYSVYILQFTMFTITLAESSHCVFTGCLSSYATGSVHLQNYPATLQLFSEDCYFTHTLTGLDGALTLTLKTPAPTLQPTLMAFLAITHYLITTCWNSVPYSELKSKSKSKSPLRPTTCRSVCLGFEPHLGLMTRY